MVTRDKLMMPNPQRYVEAITALTSSAPAQPPAPDKELAYQYNKPLYLRLESDRLIAEAEKVRGIAISHRNIMVEAVERTVLLRNAVASKPSLTDHEKQTIANLEYQALWCSSASAAYRMSAQLPIGSKIKFMQELDKLIDRTISGTEAETGKAIYLRKMQSLFSLLGAFHPGQPLKILSERLEAERDLLSFEQPNEIVATFHANGLDESEFVYEIEVPNTKLSDEQRTFFQMACNPNVTDNSIASNYEFYRDLDPWQQQLIRREAAHILEENRLRPSQMQFLPMAPNFWTRYTAVKPKTSPPVIVNEISRCGALSPRIEASEAGLIQFQEMQYSQVRANFNLKAEDNLCYTSYKQNFYGVGADAGALEHITLAHEKSQNKSFANKNHIYNLPFGRFAWISRFMNVAHNYFFENKFENNKEDPLIDDAFRAVENFIRPGRINPYRTCRDRKNPLTIDEFTQADIEFAPGTMITNEDQQRIDEIKLDLEQLYRHAIEIQRLQFDKAMTPNLRVAALRVTLFEKLKAVQEKTLKLPGVLYSKSGERKIEISFQAYVSGCKSNIDRGTLAAHCTEVLALKEHRRRQYWNSTFKAPTNVITLLTAKSWIVSILLYVPVIRTIASFITTFLVGQHLKQLNEAYAIARMERDVAIIDSAIQTNRDTYRSDTHDGRTKLHHAQAPLLQQRANIIQRTIEANVSIEAAVCQGGHSRTMPSQGGSRNVTGVKDSVLAAVAPELLEHSDHLTSQQGLSSHNHSLHKKLDLDPDNFITKAHQEAAANQYVPPQYIYQKPDDSLRNSATNSDTQEPQNESKIAGSGSSCAIINK